MRYHFVLNGYVQNCQKVLQEMEAFKHTYLSEIEEGVTYLYCREEKQAQQLKGCLTKDVCILTAEEYVPETFLKEFEKGADPEDFNCLFCYCPLYALGDKCGGNFHYNEKGFKDCTNCQLPHKRKNYGYVTGKYQELADLMKKVRENQDVKEK